MDYAETRQALPVRDVHPRTEERGRRSGERVKRSGTVVEFSALTDSLLGLRVTGKRPRGHTGGSKIKARKIPEGND